MFIEYDELGRYWVFNENEKPISGPYDTYEDAADSHPEAA